MTKALGLAVTCGLVPAVYAGAMYVVVSNWGFGSVPPGKAPHLAALVALPLLVSGAVRWWDVWVKPLPKMGAAYDPDPPRDYLAGVFKGHGLVLAIAFVGYMAFGFFADRSGGEERVKVEKLEENYQKWTAAVERAEAKMEGLKDASDDARLEASNKLYEARAGKEKTAEALKTLRERPADTHYGPSLAVGLFLSACAFFTTFMVPRVHSWSSGQAITTGAAAETEQ
jgi:gas vesicle protein